MGSQLPLVGAVPAERADAARNREKILKAAAQLMAEHGPEGLAMDDVAALAGVGVGTIYRRFGDRAGLAQALLDRAEQRFQAGFLHGPPPLGPGAPADQRLRAFLHAYVDRLTDEAPLLLIAETNTPMARFTNGAYALHHAHLMGLIAELRPDADAVYLADALLAPLAAAVFLHQRAGHRMHPERIKAGIDGLLIGQLDRLS
nr:TetR/AcrR family transcriptional regulator [Cryptosporangium aurantiacum]